MTTSCPSHFAKMSPVESRDALSMARVCTDPFQHVCGLFNEDPNTGRQAVIGVCAKRTEAEANHCGKGSRSILVKLRVGLY